MRADNIAVQVKERPRLRRFAGTVFNDLCVIAVRDKADVLTVVLAGVDKPGLGRNFARLGLAQCTERKLDSRKRLLRQIVEHITLILCLIKGLFENILPPCPLDAGIVPSGNITAVHDIGALEQLVEFQIAVAVNTGIRRDAVLVGVYEPVDHTLGELVLEIEDVIRHAEAVGHAARVLYIVK